MSIETVGVTGGNGKIGEAILTELSESGYRTVNLSRSKRREEVSDGYRTTDLLDAGEVYGSFAASDIDAVIHMGTIPGPTNHPGHATYESNAMGAYHVLAAADALGLEAVVLPSSINVMGAAYQEAQTEVEYLPVDEDHPLTPRDPYALGKQTTEHLGEGFGRRPDAPTISSLRYPWVATEAELRETFTTADRTLSALDDAWHHTTRSTLFSYLHIDDGATIARAAVETDHDGHEAYWAVAGDTTAETDSATLAAEYYPEAEVRAELSGTESLISIEKARTQLDWEPTHTWRDL